ncbi:galactosylceramide sulfotransferase-like [Diadema antillarum]|uniref:galactosylceramide sulfotransferase-like n=1 Tax=Diadema antillarum TaxID=105358 RepID=UPI003A839347
MKMRGGSRGSRNFWFYTILSVLFVFSLHHNGVFDPILSPGLGKEEQSRHADDQKQESRHTVQFSLKERSPRTEPRKCSPKQKVVFLKTHKTASTTAAAIFERYGFVRNFTFAVSNSALKFHYAYPFSRTMVKERSEAVVGWRKEDGYDMLTNHARFNKVEMDAVVHNATYITILRNPIDQLESAFGYFNLGVPFGFKKNEQLEKFMENPGKYFGTSKRFYWQFAKNNQLYDLGVDHANHDDVDFVMKAVKRLDSQFDLAMITEYLDQSLVLLRRLMCWDFDDILYISKAIRSESHRLNMTNDLRRRIAEWNHADLLLYQYFNATLWQKIREYGPEFDRDLLEFRKRLKDVFAECVNQSKKDQRDKREDKFVLKKDARPVCKELLMGDVEYTRLIQQRMWDRGILKPHP